MKRGDIVLVKYPFTDMSAEKLRPALVLLPEDAEGDLLLAFITSSFVKSPFDIPLKALPGTGLHKDSVLRLKKLMTVHRSLLQGRLGSITSEQLSLVESTLKKMFGFS